MYDRIHLPTDAEKGVELATEHAIAVVEFARERLGEAANDVEIVSEVLPKQPVEHA